MPHVVLEYTDNLKADADIPQLLRKINQTMIAQNGVFPVGGIRSRAIELTDYCMADDEEDYAFVHMTITIGAGRSQEQRQAAGDAVFEMVKEHFAAIFEKRYIALSMCLNEFNELGTWKHNNVHERFKKKAESKA